jgi:Mutator-like transposase
MGKVNLDMERRSGLSTEMVFKCACGWASVISSNAECNTLPINESFAWGCKCAPVGFTAASTLLTTLDIPGPDFRTFQKYERKCKSYMEEAFVQEMHDALKEEKELAFATGDIVVMDGVTYASITVCVDCGWSKRSYGHSYRANCGIAVIIGMRTKKIIYADTRCSTCAICDKHKDTDSQIIPPHDCYKNWNGPATAMEADIIKHGFQQSTKHGLVYSKFIGDGDSSVHVSVENVYPGIKVKKI